MRNLLKTTILALFFISNSSFTGENPAALVVELKNFHANLGGTIYLMLVDKNDQPIAKLTQSAKDKNAIFPFKNLPVGEYAVRVYHDENNNGQLDKGIFGQPTEGWGVSNDARGFMSAPPFKKMLVKVTKETHIAVTIEY